MQRAADQSLRERDKELAQKKDTLAQSQKRIAELDVIIKRLYEDNISGKLSDERFIKLSRDYELEQTNLTNLVEHLRQEVKEQEKQGKRLEVLEGRDGEMWRKVVGYIITAVIGIVIGFVFHQVGM